MTRTKQLIALPATIMAAILLACQLAAPNVHAADRKTLVRKLLEQACFDCHQGAMAEAGLELSELTWQLELRDVRATWVTIHDRVAKGEMPPDADLLSDAARAALLTSLADALHDADLADVQAVGRGPMRRLIRSEYEENLRDLLQLPHLDIRDMLPEDPAAEHCNKVATALDITRVQLDAYLDAAKAALRQAVATGVQPRTPVTYRALATRLFPKAVDHAGRESSFYAKNSQMVPLTSADLNRIRKENAHDEQMEVAIFRSATWPYYGYPDGFIAHESGEYQVRFQARAVRQVRDFRLVPSPVPQPMTFRARQPSEADVSGDVRATGGMIDVLPDEQVYATSVLLRRGETIEYSLLGLPVPFPITDHGGPLYYDFPPMPEGGHPGIAYRWIEIVGPIDSATWPPPSHRVLFDDLPIRAASDPGSAGRLSVEVVSENPRQDARRLLHRFASAAARRNVVDEELKAYQRLIDGQLDAGAPFAEAMLTGYQAFLCSGHFLFLDEPQGVADPFAIASRLSHFLWNSSPDERLRTLAADGSLAKPATLRSETERLMQDARFEKFVENFTDYWLDLKELDRDQPDIRLYPEYRGDDYLLESMGWETRAFVLSMFRENRPAAVVVDSNFAMLNDRLARHYQLPPVTGSAPQAVELPSGSRRGGLLTQAAVLKVTANGTTTSPVLRGAWVMDRIFGDPPPAPPTTVPVIAPDTRGATTIREILKAHAADSKCADCHARFDPVGFALENYDVMGGWRDRYRGMEKGDEITGIDRAGHKYSYRVAAAVDSSGQLRDGRAFENIEELKQILMHDQRQLARNLLQRLVTYATGTPVRFSDRREIEAILDNCQAGGYRVGDLLQGLVQSRIFLGGEPAEVSASVVTGSQTHDEEAR